MKTGFKENKGIVIAFYITTFAFLGICAYYMIHNAYWQIGDEAIVIAHTGMGRAFHPTGFDCMIECFGRLYPFAYNLYNVLLLFHDGYISPTDHYILQSIALVVFALAFAATSLFLLKQLPVAWKYAITFCVIVICVARVYPEFITCYTGAWIVFMFLPLFLWSACKFNDTEKWIYGVVSLLVINYINYCYETLFTIPLAMGACSLLFNYKNLSKNQRLFNWLLVSSGLLFLALYVIIVLPRATDFYKHYNSYSIFQIAFRIFVAQKIYWIALVVLIIRVWEILKKESSYTFYDSMLLASFAYFCGAAVLKLDYTYYYNFGSLTALVPIIYFFQKKFRPSLVFIITACLAAFYCIKIPRTIRNTQKARLETYAEVSKLSRFVEKENFYWYAPNYDDPTNLWVDFRSVTQGRLEIYLSWLLHQDVHFEEKTIFDNNKGIWLFPSENKVLFPDDHIIDQVQGTKIVEINGTTGYHLQ